MDKADRRRKSNSATIDRSDLHPLVLTACAETRGKDESIPNCPTGTALDRQRSCAGEDGLGELGEDSAGTRTVESQLASDEEDLIALHGRVERIPRVIFLAVELDGDLVRKGLRLRAGSQRPRSNPNTVAGDITVPLVLDDNIAVDLHEPTRRRVHIHNNGPIATHSHVLARQRHPPLRPLTCIAPIADEILFDELFRRSRTQITTVYRCHACGLEVSAVETAGAELQGAVGRVVLVEVVTVLAAQRVQH